MLFVVVCLPAAQMIRRFAIGLHVFLRNRFFVIPQVLGKLLLDFLGRFYFHLHLKIFDHF